MLMLCVQPGDTGTCSMPCCVRDASCALNLAGDGVLSSRDAYSLLQTVSDHIDMSLKPNCLSTVTTSWFASATAADTPPKPFESWISDIRSLSLSVASCTFVANSGFAAGSSLSTIVCTLSCTTIIWRCRSIAADLHTCLLCILAWQSQQSWSLQRHQRRC